MDRGLALSSAIVWIVMWVWVTASAGAWRSWLVLTGFFPSVIEESVLALAGPAGLCFVAIALAVGSFPASDAFAGGYRRLWFGLSLLQALTVALLLTQLFSFSAPPRAPDELSVCGNVRLIPQQIISTFIVAPLALAQGAVWSKLATIGWRADRGSVRDELLNAVVIALLPALAWAYVVHSDGPLHAASGEAWLLVSVPQAWTFTGCGVLLGAALWVRLRRPASPEHM